MEGVGTPRLLITGADLWRVDEETHPLLDSTWNAAEEHLAGGEVEVGRGFVFISFLTRNVFPIREMSRKFKNRPTTNHLSGIFQVGSLRLV